jgi:chemotaxis protein MotB
MSKGSHRRLAHGGGHHEENAERWLLTYADMITLLLALFIVLFAMSTINQKKFLAFEKGITATFNPTALQSPGSTGLLQQTSLMQQFQPSATQISAPNSGAAAADQKQLERIAQQVEAALAKRHLRGAASVAVNRQGVIVQVLADKAFFATDSASLGPVGNDVVDTIAGVVRQDPNNLVVQGYTDNVPITGGPYNSNWELSAVRAANVADRLNHVDGINAVRLSAQGYGQTHPIDPNTTAAGRAENRRVDVTILSLEGS